MKKRILLVEDEPGLVVTLSDRLRNEDFEVKTQANGRQGFESALSENFDLIILDVMLPGKSGIDVCRDLRQQGVSAPILMLTARTQVVDKVLGLKIGADDYVTKPFDMLELLARIEALLRRPAQGAQSGWVYHTGNLRVDLRSTTAWRNSEKIALSAREFQLLRYLIEHRGDTISRDELLKEVWGYDSTPNTRTVDVHVAWLRQKVEDDPKHPQLILTVQGLGYKFAE
ncbi:MAG: response regulator transcription factor [Terriglobia bacterium]